MNQISIFLESLDITNTYDLSAFYIILDKYKKYTNVIQRHGIYTDWIFSQYENGYFDNRIARGEYGKIEDELTTILNLFNSDWYRSRFNINIYTYNYHQAYNIYRKYKEFYYTNTDISYKCTVLYEDNDDIIFVANDHIVSMLILGSDTEWCTNEKKIFDSHNKYILYRFRFNGNIFRLTWSKTNISDYSWSFGYRTSKKIYKSSGAKSIFDCFPISIPLCIKNSIIQYHTYHSYSV